MKKVIDKDFINLLQGIHINLAIKLKNNKLGKKRSSAKGSSVEFSDYREYSAGDDFRRIDWSALARFEKLFIKLYTEEQQASISLFVDTSQSMGFEKKRALAIKIASLFAYTSLNEYDKVSMMLFDEKIHTEVKNINTKQGFYKLAELLENTRFQKNSNLLESIQQALPTLKKGYSIILSDFLYDAKLDEVLNNLRFKNQEIILCHILNKDELMADYKNNVRLKDSETGEEINIDINEETRRLYHKNLEKYLKKIQESADKWGAQYFLVNADETMEKFIENIKRLS